MSNDTKKIVIVGVGALGSHLLLFSRNFNVQFKIIDFDRIEKKNTMSQFHTAMGVGRNKTQALQQSMQALFGIKTEAVPHRLTNDNVDALLGGADLVIDCLDNAASRKIIQDFVRQKKIPCLHGALAADGQFGSAIWDANFNIDSEDVKGGATCEDGEHLPFIAIVSAELASAVQKFLKNGKQSSCHIHPGGRIQLS